MTLAGAQGSTAEEVARVMYLPELQPAGLHAAFGSLVANLKFEFAQPADDFGIKRRCSEHAAVWRNGDES